MYSKLSLSLSVCFLMCTGAAADFQVIKDMAGREVKLSAPSKIKQIYSSSAAMNYFLYALAPEKLCALNRRFKKEELPFILPVVRDKPVLGGWLGQGGKISNMEELLKVNPQVVFSSMLGSQSINDKIEKSLHQLGLPVVYVKITDLHDIPNAFRFTGSIIGSENRAEELYQSSRKLLERIGKLNHPSRSKTSIYYTYSPDGLHTCVGHNALTEPIYLAGGKNIFESLSPALSKKTRHHMSQLRVKMNIEIILAHNPDIILIGSRKFYETIQTSSQWQALSAVKQKRFHLIPSVPMSWLDKPHSFMRFLGVLWIAHLIDPNEVPLEELVGIVKASYKIFLEYNITDKEALDLISPQHMKPSVSAAPKKHNRRVGKGDNE